MIQSVDHLALLPLYLASGTAVLVLIIDLVANRRTWVIGSAVLGGLATAVAAPIAAGADPSFCTGGACSWIPSSRAAVVAVLFELLTVGVLA
ncbi:MAG TPA: NADH-quinone oxidoreductase subunit N, partial [Actinoplanes sp.]|nr:NADH-quinone oxidoreductase subunit N [Actinoplanes sp.]